MISTPLMLLVLASALLHAVWNALIKGAHDKASYTLAVSAIGGVLAALALPWLPSPRPESWPFLAASCAVHTLYLAGLMHVYQHGDLGQVYTLMRGGSPLLIAAAGVLLGEVPTALTWAGIALISTGIIALGGFTTAPGHGRANRLALAIAVTIAAYTLVDGSGARLAGDAVSYTLWVFVLNPLPLLAYTLWQRGAASLPALVRLWRPATAGALCAFGSYALTLWAMTRAPLATVAALRETSVIFAAVIGALLLGEHQAAWRLGAATLVVAGIVVIKQT